MAEPKRGLSSWLHVPQTAVATAAASVAASEQVDTSATSPLDISLAILRAKEAISRISPDKRALVEEIDEDPDDAEFDEKAHWGRRSAAARRKKLKPGRGKAQAPPGYSIKAFCTVQGGAKDDATAVTAKIAQELALQALEFVPESAGEHSEELGADTSAQPQAPVVDEPTSSLDEPEFAASLSSVSSPMDETVAVATTVANVDTETPQMGRPKRQAVLRAQDGVSSLLKLQMNALIDLRTPPRKKVLKKAAAPSRLELTTPTVGRKRKLEMDRSTPSPATKADGFFLTDEAKRQLQELEAVAKLREQLRATREKDLAFFRGKTGVNPFFEAPRAPLARTMSSSGADGDASGAADAIEIDDATSATPGSQERPRRSRWSKHAVHFPAVQHTIYTTVDDDDQHALAPLGIAKKKTPARGADVIEVLDDDDGASNGVTLRSSSGMAQQVLAEASLSDLFWFRQYYEARDAATGLDSVPPSQRLQFPCEWESETTVIDTVVETYGVREKRVRELLASLEAARAKRCDKAPNLTLVDRYTPVRASGVVGNKDALRLLASWLGAWKLGGSSGGARRGCFEQELFAFEGDASESDDDDLADLCRVFVLEGESGAGKSAAVYACADELGYNVIEINAGQSRAGRHIVEIAGEATQSTRVLHVGGGDKSKHKNKSTSKQRSAAASKKRSRKSLDTTAAHLSLVLFEDVDLVFDEDKGFYASLCSIAKHSKCPIVLTCRALPDHFPAAPQRLRQVLSRPSVPEFSAWMLLVAHLEALPLTPGLVESLAHFFRCDVRQALHFVQTHTPQLARRQHAAHWTWQPESLPETAIPIVVLDDGDDARAEATGDNFAFSTSDTPVVVVPAWTHYPARAFDLLSNSVLHELAACASKPEEDKSASDKVADARLLESLSDALDAVSVADVWSSRLDADDEDAFFDRERDHLKALDVRAAGLSTFLTPGGLGATALQSRASETSSAAGVRRSLDAALAEQQRSARSLALRSMQSKMELPLAALGAGHAGTRFALDYMPMLGRIGNSSASQQQSRRRASRRHHYLSDVIADMSLLDELHAFTTFAHAVDSDQIVAASPSSSPLAS